MSARVCPPVRPLGSSTTAWMRLSRGASRRTSPMTLSVSLVSSVLQGGVS